MNIFFLIAVLGKSRRHTAADFLPFVICTGRVWIPDDFCSNNWAAVESQEATLHSRTLSRCI